VTGYRPFLNSDPPALVRLWNQAVPPHLAARPLRVHELDDHAFGRIDFDRQGLIVAEQQGQVVGFVHAGFGPDQPPDPRAPFRLSRELGNICMLLVDPRAEDPELPRGLILEAERYLRSRGAKVLYAGGQYPLNPFYWGLYAGSEGAGVLSSHPVWPTTLAAMGYEPISTAVLLEFDLDTAEPRDPRAVLIRRQTELEVEEDPLPCDWWKNVALGDFHLDRHCLYSRGDGAELARATTWDMDWFGRVDGRPRMGLIGVEVAASHRRRGFGRYLVSQVLRRAREHAASRVEVQTMATNEPALALYQGLGFRPIEQSTVYRLPSPLTDRSRSG
jgi:ribosomal protein S18 acetylase RimI-like enzyme